MQIGHGFFGLGELVELGVYFSRAGFFQVFDLLIERLGLLLLLRKLAVASVVMPTQSQQRGQQHPRGQGKADDGGFDGAQPRFSDNEGFGAVLVQHHHRNGFLLLIH